MSATIAEHRSARGTRLTVGSWQRAAGHHDSSFGGGPARRCRMAAGIYVVLPLTARMGSLPTQTWLIAPWARREEAMAYRDIRGGLATKPGLLESDQRDPNTRPGRSRPGSAVDGLCQHRLRRRGSVRLVAAPSLRSTLRGSDVRRRGSPTRIAAGRRQRSLPCYGWFIRWGRYDGYAWDSIGRGTASGGCDLPDWAVRR